MNRAEFAEGLRSQIVAALRAFREEHRDETPYGFALLGGQSGEPYLGTAIATEEGNRRVGARYQKLGYRHVLLENSPRLKEERSATVEELATWLRWANPDDGWHYGGLPDHKRIQEELCALIEAGGLGEKGEDFEEFCTEVLASLHGMPAWQEEMARGLVIVGFTYGEDPDDFLRTATRANPWSVVNRLWAERWRARELGGRIRSPYR
jgi:hypothetical protein